MAARLRAARRLQLLVRLAAVALAAGLARSASPAGGAAVEGAAAAGEMEGFQCAQLPTLRPAPKSNYISLGSLAEHAARAPGYDPAAGAGPPFDCGPLFCRSSAASRAQCNATAAQMGERSWDGASLTSCGADCKGWRLGWEDVVIGIPLTQELLDRLDHQVRSTHASSLVIAPTVWMVAMAAVSSVVMY